MVKYPNKGKLKMSNKLEINKTGSLVALRNYLQDDCNMLQVWAGKTETDDDFIMFLSRDLEQFAVMFSKVGSREYIVQTGGDVVFLHDKNMKRLGMKRTLHRSKK